MHPPPSIPHRPLQPAPTSPQQLSDARWREERSDRRRAHEELQALRGNIRVMCRVRPPTPGAPGLAPSPLTLSQLSHTSELSPAPANPDTPQSLHPYTPLDFPPFLSAPDAPPPPPPPFTPPLCTPLNVPSCHLTPTSKPSPSTPNPPQHTHTHTRRGHRERETHTHTQTETEGTHTHRRTHTPYTPLDPSSHTPFTTPLTHPPHTPPPPRLYTPGCIPAASEGALSLAVEGPNGRLVHHPFEFSSVLGAEGGQEEAYREIWPVARSCLDGYNCCVLAYGQTGAGKTFTMMGGEGESRWGGVGGGVWGMCGVVWGVVLDGVGGCLRGCAVMGLHPDGVPRWVAHARPRLSHGLVHDTRQG